MAERYSSGIFELKKIFGISFSKKLLAFLSLAALVLALIPLYRLTMYAIPRYDDYSYGLNLWREQRYGYGLRTILKAGYETALGFHYSWQGTYASIFMMAQMPGALGFEYYFIGPVLLITSLVISVFFLSMVLTGKYLKGELSDRITFSVIVTLTLVECIYTAQQGFFWYNSGVHYVFMHSLMFIMVGVMVILADARNIIFKIFLELILSFLAFACAGANFVTCVQGFLLLTGFTFLTALRRKLKAGWFLLPIFVYIFGLRLNLLAPGNEARKAQYTGLDPVRSILYSFKAGYENIWKFSGMFVIALLLLALPVIWMLVKNVSFDFRRPWLFTALSYCFYCTGYTSSFYSMGNAGLSRTWIAVCFTFQILLFACEVYWAGWFAHSKVAARLRDKLNIKVRHYVIHYLAVFVLMLVSFHYTIDKIGAVSSFGAYYYVHTGEAYAFHEEFLNRVRIIGESDGGIVDVPEYGYKPWFLINRDISEDPLEEENRIMADYFGVPGIRRVPRE